MALYLYSKQTPSTWSLSLRQSSVALSQIYRVTCAPKTHTSTRTHSHAHAHSFTLFDHSFISFRFCVFLFQPFDNMSTVNWLDESNEKTYASQTATKISLRFYVARSTRLWRFLVFCVSWNHKQILFCLYGATCFVCFRLILICYCCRHRRRRGRCWCHWDFSEIYKKIL